MIIWIATGNKGKAEEFTLLLKEHQLYFLKDIHGYQEPKETGSSFEENARIKAQALQKQKPQEWVLGEDSGLVVPALGNAPGIYSARYAGPDATDKDNLNLLLRNMRPFTDNNRSAAFVSHIFVFSQTGKEYSVQGRVEGHITYKSVGDRGFGYDPIFIPNGEKQSFAQLGVEYKNQASHRFHAVQALLSKIEKK